MFKGFMQTLKLYRENVWSTSALGTVLAVALGSAGAGEMLNLECLLLQENGDVISSKPTKNIKRVKTSKKRPLGTSLDQSANVQVYTYTDYMVLYK